MKATKEQIKQWLDMQIGAMYVSLQPLVLTEKPDIFSDDENAMVPDVQLLNIGANGRIHIDDRSLRLVAKVMELPIKVIDRFELERETDPEYRYELQMYYNGVKFMCLESERDYNERGELA